MAEHSTDCDDCGASIPYGITCWMVTRHFDEDGTKVVKIVCDRCHNA